MPTIPLSWLTPEERRRLYLQALEKIIEFAEEKLKVDRSQLAARMISPGDESNATDATMIDVDFKTAATTGQEEWTEDSADITAGDLSSVLASGEQVNENTVIGVFGFMDLTPNPDLTMIQLLNGSEKLISDQVEHCYAERPYGGIFVDEKGDVVVALWGPKDFIDWKMNFKTSADKNVILLGFTVETKGKNITVSHLGR